MPKQIDELSEALSLLDTFKLHAIDDSGNDVYFDATVLADYMAAKIAQYTSVTPAADDSVIIQDQSDSSAVKTALVSEIGALFSGVLDVTAASNGGVGVTDSSGDHQLTIDFGNIQTENAVDSLADTLLYLDDTDGTVKKTVVNNLGVTGAVETGSIASGSLQLGATIIKVFQFNSTSDDNEVISIPAAFPNNCHYVQVSGDRYPATAFNWTTSTFTVNRDDSASGTVIYTALAIGD